MTYTGLADGRVMMEALWKGTSAINGYTGKGAQCLGVVACNEEGKIDKLQWSCDFSGILKAMGAM